MIKVLKRTGVSRDTGTSVTNEVLKVSFGALVAFALIVGVISFASLGVGIVKAVLLALA